MKKQSPRCAPRLLRVEIPTLPRLPGCAAYDTEPCPPPDGVPTIVVTRESLMSDVWDENWFGATKTLDVHVSSLRRKLMLHGEPAMRISTVRGRGYRFEAEPSG